MAKRKAGIVLAGRRRFGRSPKLILLMALVVATVAVEGAFGGGFALSGVGSKAINMGGAFRGLADDWSAAYWNPAGLTQLEESEVTAMLVGISPRVEYTPDITYGGVDVGYRNGLTRYPNDKTTFIPDFSGFFKFEGIENYTVGLAVFVPMGLSSEWDLYNPTPNMDIRYPYPWYDHKATLTVLDIHPTIARSFLDGNLSLGAGFSFQRADVTLKETTLRPSGIPIPHEYILIDSELNGDGWGFGANFGILYKLSDKLQFGVSGKTSTTLKLEGSVDQEIYTFDDDDLRDILLNSVTTPEDSQEIRFLFAMDNHTASPSAKADLKTPADVGFGLAYKPTDKLTLTGQVDYTMWSALDETLIELDGLDPSGQPAEDTPIVFNWDDIVRFCFGGEYWLKDPVALRFGYFFDPSPIPDETFTPLIPDLGDKHSFNIGAALRVSGVELAYNFEYISFEDREVTTLADVNDDGDFDNFPGLFKSSLFASHVSFTYRF
jgi:long-chain fatty acid transport protein